MSSKSEIASDESMRLDRLGIPYLYVHCCEDRPVTVVEPSTMRSIVKKRNEGTMVSGLFVS